MKLLYTVCLLLSFSSSTFADDLNKTELLPSEDRLNGSSLQNAFGSTKDIALECTVRLLRNNKLIGMGGIFHSSGYIFTKASSCVGAREAKTFDGQRYGLKIKKRYEEFDLAIYKLISDENLFPKVNWNTENNTTEGSWVIAAHPSLKEIRVGVHSAKLRKIGREGGVMGVLLTSDKTKVGGVKVSEVVPQAAAYRAGLLESDIITHADGRRVKNQDSLVKIVGSKDPGDVVRIKLSRKGEPLDFLVTLGHRSVTFDLFNRNLQMSGPVSKRKDNFPMILQHDLPLEKEAMGGPLFDIEGKCIGFNIARVDRVTVYALPSSDIKQIVDGFLENLLTK